jgi:hypothetical protein
MPAKIHSSMLLVLIIIGACAASPAFAQSKSLTCAQATAAYNAAVANRDKKVDEYNDGTKEAGLIQNELANLDILMTSAGAAVGDPVGTQAMQATWFARKVQLQSRMVYLQVAHDQLANETYQLADVVQKAQSARDEACKPSGFWATLQALFAGATGSATSTAIVRYPRPVHVYHIDRYYVQPTADQLEGHWDITLIGFDKGEWMVSSDVIPRSDGIVGFHITGYSSTSISFAHVNVDDAFNSSAELCPRVEEMKLKLNTDQKREYGCE